MLLQTLFLPAAGTIVFPISNDLPLKITEIIGNGATTITQHIGSTTYTYGVGNKLVSGLPATITTTDATTIMFDSYGQFSVVSTINDIPVGGAALLNDGTNPPRIVFVRPNGSTWYGPVFSSTP
jgi:hypothetical protein